jgi:hypothetical protein
MLPLQFRNADTKLPGRFGAKRCGPSYRLERNASAVLKNFDRHPKNPFATISALFGRAAVTFDVRLWGLNRPKLAALEGRLLPWLCENAALDVIRAI